MDNLNLTKLSKVSNTELTKAMSAFIDTVGVTTNRATFYNTKEEQEKAALEIHKAVFTTDRGLYAVMSTFPDATDYAKQLTLQTLLDRPYENDPGMISMEFENKIIRYLAHSMPITRLLRTFENIKAGRVNNARTRRLLLGTIIPSEALELWAVKYRKKIKEALTHAWGQSVATSIKKILDKKNFNHPVYTALEDKTLKKYVDKYFNNKTSQAKVYECLSFVLGNSYKKWTLPLFVAFEGTKTDPSKAAKLPLEVAQGLISTYHKGKSINLLELTKENLTAKQKKTLQAKAEKEGVKIDFDPKAFDALELYIYALERGMTDDIKSALIDKAKNAAAGFPIRHNKVGILVDTSLSMMGDKTNKNKPMASAMALRDVLIKTSKEVVTVPNKGIGEILVPYGDTSLAEDLVELLDKKLDAIYIISDGYENAPAGRVNEVITVARKIGINIPIYQFSPVFAAETKSVRTLSAHVQALPVYKPSSLWLPVFKMYLEQDPREAVKMLFNRTLNLLTN